MDSDVEQLVRAIHASSGKAAVFVTGGAAQGTSWLLGVPGASASVLEVVVPYSRGSLVDLLGQEPAQYCSAGTALVLARAALKRAAALSSIGEPVIGLAASCALASEPPKRGAHRAFVAAHSSAGARLLSVTLAKGARSRWQEEQLVSRALLWVLAEVSGVDASSLELPLQGCQHPSSITATNSDGSSSHQQQQQQLQQQQGSQTAQHLSQQQQQQQDELTIQFFPAPAEPLAELLAGRLQCVEVSGGRMMLDAPRGPGQLYLPGSFNPLHDGHTGMLAAAAAAAAGEGGGGGQAGGHACFELTVVNADKGQLSLEELQKRVRQFVSAGLPLLVTRAPLLVDKARLLPGSTFVLGWDTAVRIVMPKYYGGSEAAMVAVFDDIRAAGCRFLVAGRLDDKGDGSFKTLADIPLPPGLADLFEALPEAAFRADISSTQLRQAGQGLPVGPSGSRDEQ